MSLLRARQRTAEVMADGAGAPIYHCLLCRAPTPHEHLITYGARCFDCFRAYCREVQPSQSYTKAGDQSSPREVVQRLLDRQANGERMSEAQLKFLAVAKKKTHPELCGGEE